MLHQGIRSSSSTTCNVWKGCQPGFLKKFAAMSAGNAMEWFDFAAFGAFADILGELFFPNDSPAVQLLKSMAIFGAAFVMRPLGGVVMGWIGDTMGREKALIISIVLMLFPSFLIGCLPTVAHVGVSATVALLLLRLVQGVAVGGELVGAMIYTVEATHGRNKGFWGGACKASCNLGTSLGVGMSALLRYVLTRQQLLQWGWRVPFLCGLLFGTFGLSLRRNMQFRDTEKEVGALDNATLFDLALLRRLWGNSGGGAFISWCSTSTTRALHTIGTGSASTVATPGVGDHNDYGDYSPATVDDDDEEEVKDKDKDKDKGEDTLDKQCRTSDTKGAIEMSTNLNTINHPPCSSDVVISLLHPSSSPSSSPSTIEAHINNDSNNTDNNADLTYNSQQCDPRLHLPLQRDDPALLLGIEEELERDALNFNADVETSGEYSEMYGENNARLKSNRSEDADYDFYYDDNQDKHGNSESDSDSGSDEDENVINVDIESSSSPPVLSKVHLESAATGSAKRSSIPSSGSPVIPSRASTKVAVYTDAHATTATTTTTSTWSLFASYWREVIIVMFIVAFHASGIYALVVWMVYFTSDSMLIGPGCISTTQAMSINFFLNVTMVVMLPLCGLFGDFLGEKLLSVPTRSAASTSILTTTTAATTATSATATSTSSSSSSLSVPRMFKKNTGNSSSSSTNCNSHSHISSRKRVKIASEGFRLAMIVAVVLMIVLVTPCFQLILSRNLWYTILGQLVLTSILSLYAANLPAFAISMFNSKMCYTGLGVAYNVSHAVFSSTAPVLQTVLVMLAASHASGGIDDDAGTTDDNNNANAAAVASGRSVIASILTLLSSSSSSINNSTNNYWSNDSNETNYNNGTDDGYNYYYYSQQGANNYDNGNNAGGGLPYGYGYYYSPVLGGGGAGGDGSSSNRASSYGANVDGKFDTFYWSNLLYDGRYRPAYYMMFVACLSLLSITKGVEYCRLLRKRRRKERKQKIMLWRQKAYDEWY